MNSTFRKYTIIALTCLGVISIGLTLAFPPMIFIFHAVAIFAFFLATVAASQADNTTVQGLTVVLLFIGTVSIVLKIVIPALTLMFHVIAVVVIFLALVLAVIMSHGDNQNLQD